MEDQSHPSWVRGLKQDAMPDIKATGTSHPSWVRGLKLDVQGEETAYHCVAPLVGAWIETAFL